MNTVTLGELLRKLRGDRSLRDISKEAGLNHTYLSELESGINKRTGKPVRPSLDVILKLSSVYNVQISDLLDIEGIDSDLKNQLENYQTKINLDYLEDLERMEVIKKEYVRKMVIQLFDKDTSLFDDLYTLISAFEKGIPYALTINPPGAISQEHITAYDLIDGLNENEVSALNNFIKIMKK